MGNFVFGLILVFNQKIYQFTYYYLAKQKICSLTSRLKKHYWNSGVPFFVLFSIVSFELFLFCCYKITQIFFLIGCFHVSPWTSWYGHSFIFFPTWILLHFPALNFSFFSFMMYFGALTTTPKRILMFLKKFQICSQSV